MLWYITIFWYRLFRLNGSSNIYKKSIHCIIDGNISVSNIFDQFKFIRWLTKSDEHQRNKLPVAWLTVWWCGLLQERKKTVLSKDLVHLKLSRESHDWIYVNVVVLQHDYHLICIGRICLFNTIGYWWYWLYQCQWL